MKAILFLILFLPAIIMLFVTGGIDMQGMWLYYFASLAFFAYALVTKEA